MYDDKVIAIDKFTMDIVAVYDNPIECARANKKSKHSVYDSVNEGRLAAGRLFFRYGFDYDRDETFEGKRNRPVVARNVKTGEVLEFNSLTECGRHFGRRVDSVSGNVRHGNLLGGTFAIGYAR